MSVLILTLAVWLFHDVHITYTQYLHTLNGKKNIFSCNKKVLNTTGNNIWIFIILFLFLCIYSSPTQVQLVPNK